MLVSGSVPFLTIVAVISLFFVSHLAEIAHLSAGKRKELRPIPLCEVGAEGQEGAAPCVPEDSVYFLKVPKCGSTTVFQVLIAYGVKHGLTFALPVRISLDPLSPKILCPDCRSPDGRYNMVVSHAQYNKEGVKQVMKEGAKYVAIVREAASHYESLWGYNGYEKTLHMDLKTFIRTWNHTEQRFHLNLVSNAFGIKSDRDGFETNEMYAHLTSLNKDFDLVMITERFDESLVLLKHLLCWTTEDVAYVKANIRKDARKTNLSESEKEQLRRMNRLDVLLYNFFKGVFEEKVKAFGEERMKTEVQELQQASARLINDCGAELVSAKARVKEWRVKNDSNICAMISMNGVTIQNRLKERQRLWASSNWTFDLKTWTFK